MPTMGCLSTGLTPCPSLSHAPAAPPGGA